MRAKALMDSWKHHHPEWEYVLWTPTKIYRDLIEAGQFSALSEYLGYMQRGQLEHARAVVTYEILWFQGGLVIAPDMECFRPIDDLVGDHSTIAHRGPYDPLVLEDSILGAEKESELADRVRWRIPFYVTRYGEKEYFPVCGPGMLTEVWSGLSSVQILKKAQVCPYRDSPLTIPPQTYAVKRWHEHL